MPPKKATLAAEAALRQQPRRSTRSSAAGQSQSSPPAPDQIFVAGSDGDNFASASQPPTAPSQTLTDPDRPQSSKPPTPLKSTKRSRAAFEENPATSPAVDTTTADFTAPTTADITTPATADTTTPTPADATAPTTADATAPTTADITTPAPAAATAGLSKKRAKYQPKTNVVRNVNGHGVDVKKLWEDRDVRPGTSTDWKSSGRKSRKPKGKLPEGLASGPLGDASSPSANPAPKQRGSRSAPEPRQSSQLNQTTTTTVKLELDVPEPTTRLRKPRQKEPAGAKMGVKSSTAREDPPEFADVSSDEDSGQGQAMNIEHINLISDDESEEDSIQVRRGGMGDRSGRKKFVRPVFRPVRVDRSDHEVRRAGVNTDVPSTASTELRQRSREKTGDAVDGSGAMDVVSANAKGKSKEVEFVRNERRWRGVYEDEEAAPPEVKQEPDDVMNVNFAPIESSTPSDTEVDQSLVGLDGPADGSTMKANSRPQKLTFRDRKGLVQTEEDRAELKIHEEDKVAMVDELLSMHPSHQADALNIDSAGPKLFLFQFPPDTPILKAQSSVESGPKATPIPMPGAPETIAIKSESEEPVDEAKTMSAANPEWPAGRVGKLRVHESGRVTLDWGGTSLEMNRGIDVNFLQDAVAIPPLEAGQERGVATALSKIRGKFVVTPDWEKILQ